VTKCNSSEGFFFFTLAMDMSVHCTVKSLETTINHLIKKAIQISYVNVAAFTSVRT